MTLEQARSSVSKLTGIFVRHKNDTKNIDKLSVANFAKNRR
jgi:hypothetical protein